MTWGMDPPLALFCDALPKGLAEVGIFGDLTPNALAFGLQQIAHCLQLTHEVVDLLQRCASHSLQHDPKGVGNYFTLLGRGCG
jgi:hypothetical protein